jgi:hypothetical protein
MAYVARGILFWRLMVTDRLYQLSSLHVRTAMEIYEDAS